MKKNNWNQICLVTYLERFFKNYICAEAVTKSSILFIFLPTLLNTIKLHFETNWSTAFSGLSLN